MNDARKKVTKFGIVHVTIDRIKNKIENNRIASNIE